jgi:hypothetical protein
MQLLAWKSLIEKNKQMNYKTIVLLLFLSQPCFSQPANYKSGDTLTVFTLGGLKLREGSSLSSNVLSTMKLGDKVVVVDYFNSDPKYFQTIEGFSGHWIQVRFNGLQGYAFDGFLSSLPVPRIDLIKKDESEKTQDEIEIQSHYRGQEIEHTLKEYIKSEFQFICDPVEYYNGFDGEGYHYLTIQKISRGFTVISHGGWEGSGTELLMPNVRLSEIKNLIILLAQRSGVDNTLIEEIKSNVKGVSEERRRFQEILRACSGIFCRA